MFKAISSPWLIESDHFQARKAATAPPKNAPDTNQCKKKLDREIKELTKLQEMLYANDTHSVLLIFQALDAAGKDSTIRAVMSGINPAGCEVYSFKKPSHLELDHDFLWRTSIRLPERGRIGIFNRSYYEEVLVVRVHPEYLEYQRIPEIQINETFWDERMESIAVHEKHLARNGTVILKFWLNVSKEEQKRRFISRIEEEKKNWKFSESDLDERELWDEYIGAFQSAIRATSKAWAPWYAIPADHKPYMRWQVAKIIRQNLATLGLSFPTVDKETLDSFASALQRLNAD